MRWGKVVVAATEQAAVFEPRTPAGYPVGMGLCHMAGPDLPQAPGRPNIFGRAVSRIGGQRIEAGARPASRIGNRGRKDPRIIAMKQTFSALLPALGLTALMALPAHANTLLQRIEAQLRAQGFTHITAATTFFGSTRIDAASPTQRREIVFNPSTGEIVRDYWSDLSGKSQPGAVTILNSNPTSGKGDSASAASGSNQATSHNENSQSGSSGSTQSGSSGSTSGATSGGSSEGSSGSSSSEGSGHSSGDGGHSGSHD